MGDTHTWNRIWSESFAIKNDKYINFYKLVYPEYFHIPDCSPVVYTSFVAAFTHKMVLLIFFLLPPHQNIVSLFACFSVLGHTKSWANLFTNQRWILFSLVTSCCCTLSQRLQQANAWSEGKQLPQFFLQEICF